MKYEMKNVKKENGGRVTEVNAVVAGVERRAKVEKSFFFFLEKRSVALLL